jgi:thymidine phosphorylase
LALAAEMLQSTAIAGSNQEALQRAGEALDSGSAAEVFARMVAALGGPTDLIDRHESHLPKAPVVRPVAAPRSGFVGAVSTREVGLAVVALGGGRTRPQDSIDHAVGLTGLQPVGSEIGKGEPLAIVHARSEDAADRAVAVVTAAYRIAEKRPGGQKSVHRRVTARD